MTTPMANNYRECYIQYAAKTDGTPAHGYVEFKTNSILVDETTGIVLADDTINVYLDENGRVDVSLLACDTPGIRPSDWSWVIEEKIEGGGLWWFQITTDMVGPIDLSNLYSPGQAPPIISIQGPPGDKGDKGDPGDQGDPGPRGPVGPLAPEDIIAGDNISVTQNPNETVTISAPTPIVDHGALSGLLDDDHPQYLNDTRGDTRYDPKGSATSAVADHVAEDDPHPQYLTSEDTIPPEIEIGDTEPVEENIQLYINPNGLPTPPDLTDLDDRYVNTDGDTMTGQLILPGDPEFSLSAATKAYADTKVSKSGDTMTGVLTSDAGFTTAGHLTTARDGDYGPRVVIDDAAGNGMCFTRVGGELVTRANVAGGGVTTQPVTIEVATPTGPKHAATKGYVDALLGGAGVKILSGTYPGSDAPITFPAGYFTQAPNVIVSPSGAGGGTGGDLTATAGNITANGFNAQCRIAYGGNAGTPYGFIAWIAIGV